MSKNNAKTWERPTTGRREDESRSRKLTVIFCEDSKSAADYFRSFPINGAPFEVRVEGTGRNTESLVKLAIQEKRKAETQKTPFYAVWCVFDRDNFPQDHYNRAFDLAESADIQIAWANEAFELWYLLHFDYMDSALSRTQYSQKLKRNGIKYDKTDQSIYDQLQPHQGTALQNAKRLEREWQEQRNKFPHRENPSTSVHKLVEYLNHLANLGAAN